MTIKNGDFAIGYKKEDKKLTLFINPITEDHSVLPVCLLVEHVEEQKIIQAISNSLIQSYPLINEYDNLMAVDSILEKSDVMDQLATLMLTLPEERLSYIGVTDITDFINNHRESLSELIAETNFQEDLNGLLTVYKLNPLYQ